MAEGILNFPPREKIIASFIENEMNVIAEAILASPNGGSPAEKIGTFLTVIAWSCLTCNIRTRTDDLWIEVKSIALCQNTACSLHCAGPIMFRTIQTRKEHEEKY